MQIRDAIEDYLHHISVVDQKAITSIQANTRDLRISESYLTLRELHQINDISYADIQDFIQEQRKVKKSNSVNRMISTLHNFHHYITFTYPKENDPSLFIHSKKDGR